MSATRKSAQPGASRTEQPGQNDEGFTEEERAAIKERAQEVRASKRRASKAPVDEEAALLEKIAEMGPADRAMAQRVHEVIASSAPDLSPKLWYGMPAYAKNGKVVCFFQPAEKFKSRYATLGFNDPAALDDGAMWPVAFALTELNPDVEARIGRLVKAAAG
jgi:uncharacterized protein YdhG (YjbR/CyaY superfamily)